MSCNDTSLELQKAHTGNRHNPRIKMKMKTIEANRLSDLEIILSSLQELPDYCKEAAVNHAFECIEEHGKLPFDSDLVCESFDEVPPHVALKAAFLWSDTPEGYDYWNTVAAKLKEVHQVASKLSDQAEPEIDQAETTTFGKEWWFAYQERIFTEIMELTRRKNADYTGGGDTENPFANFDGAAELGVDPIVGLVVRMGDKFQRIKSFARLGKLEVTEEGDSIEDAFRDIIGYSALVLGMFERRRLLSAD